MSFVPCIRTSAKCLLLTTATGAMALSCSAPAFAQVPPPNTLVGVCSGVSLPRSVVTGIISPVLTGIYTPIETNVNAILGIIDPLTGVVLPPPLSVNLSGLLTTAASGANIGLNVVAADGTLVGPGSTCNAAADSFTLDTPAGVSIGGNAITGLGAAGQQAVAGEIDSIAIGNRATTAGTALGAIALGSDAAVGAGAVGSVAIGSGATASAANSVAIGANSAATRPNTVSVGAVGAERIVANVAPGTIGTDAVNLDQLNALAAVVPANAVQYDDGTRALVTLGGAAGTRITNLAPGVISATSTDAVNGAQLDAVQTQVTANTSAITNLSISIANGGLGPVQYSNPAAPTVPNGGVPTNDLTLVGAVPGPVGLHNVANGSITLGSTDAVNGGQIFGLALGTVNAVQYQTDAVGNRTNNVVLVGGNAAAPVTISGLAPGQVVAGSTDAVNGSQLAATNGAVVAAQTTANTALALGANSVQYDSPARNAVTLGGTGAAAVALRNLADGVAQRDAVNLGQLQAAQGNAVNIANAYTDGRFDELDFNLRDSNRDARAGTSAALAAAGMPQAMNPGRTMVSGGVGTYRGRGAIALGASRRASNGQSVYKIGVTYDSSSHVGANAGFGFEF